MIRILPNQTIEVAPASCYGEPQNEARGANCKMPPEFAKRSTELCCRLPRPKLHAQLFKPPRSIIGDCRRVADVLSGKSTGRKNAHELFSANSMSAYRILGPGGAERQRALSFKPAS